MCIFLSWEKNNLDFIFQLCAHSLKKHENKQGVLEGGRFVDPTAVAAAAAEARS